MQTTPNGGAASDPSLFNDPVAERTEWSSLRGGGTNFRTHKLVEVQPHRLEFRPTVGARLFYLIFAVVGIGTLAYLLATRLPSGLITTDKNTLWPMLFGLVFALMGCTLFFFGTTPIVFDKQKGYFWKSRKAPDLEAGPQSSPTCVALHRIHALQILTNSCSEYNSYELNLVLDDGQRMNVVNHGHAAGLREDAATLSVFLGRPVWFEQSRSERVVVPSGASSNALRATDLRLPADLLAFLNAGKILEYKASSCEAGKVTLARLADLKLQRFPMQTAGLSEFAQDPHCPKQGSYLVAGVSLVAKCKSGYDPNGLLLWLPIEQRYAAWTTDNAFWLVQTFGPETTWDRIAADPGPYINVQWPGIDPKSPPVTNLVPWPAHPYSERKLESPHPA